MNGADAELVVVGASWGGLDAVSRLLDLLPDEFTCPVALVQHRATTSSQLTALLSRHTRWRVREVEDKDHVAPSTLFVAPASYHVYVEKGRFALSTEAPVRWSRPSIDVTFASAADAYAEHLVGVVLTGANADGAEGLARIHHRGGVTLVQDPATADQPAMPRAALERVPTATVLDLDGIAANLLGRCGARS